MSFDELEKVMVNLNEVRDSLCEKIRVFNDKCREMNFGIKVVTSVPIRELGMLGFSKVDNKWQVAVYYPEEDRWVVALGMSSASRTEIVQSFDELLQDMIKAAEHQLDEMVNCVSC